MRRSSWTCARVVGNAPALLVLCGLLPACLGTLRVLGDLNDTIGSDDLEPGAVCENGCVREVVNGVAVSLGEVDCELLVQNLLDHTNEDVSSGALNVVHSCTNADGDLLYEGEGSCLYSVCVTAEWTGALVTYDVVVEHEPSDAEHSVRLQLYMNEYENLTFVPDLSFEAVGSTSASASPRCSLGTTCEAASECTSGYSKVEVIVEDEYGDGWTGALPNRANTWSIAEALSDGGQPSVAAEGTLAANNLRGATPLCLQDGSYTFSSTADAAWSEESTWTLCGVTGGAGGSLEFEVSDGTCRVVSDSNASGPPASSASTSSADLCTMPDEFPCVGLSVGISETSGPSVGMYYDETCFDGGGGRTGCGGGGEPGCRICFVNRDFWSADFPDQRYPDWMDCPCCVADSIGVTCQEGQDTLTAVRDETLLEQAEAFFWEGSVPMLAGMSGLIGLGVIVACCCFRSIQKSNQKVVSLKHYRVEGCKDKADDYGDESTNVSPTLGEFSVADFHGTALDAYRKKSADLQQVHHKALVRDTLPANDKKLPKVGSRAAAAARKIAPDAAEAPDLVRGEGEKDATGSTLMDERLSSALPAVEPTAPLRLPGASRKLHPSDASWSSSKLGVSVSGKRNPRWSGSRELNAYLRRTGYNELDDDKERKEEEHGPEGRGGGGRISRSMQALGGSKTKSSNKVTDWVYGQQGGRGRQKAAVTPEDRQVTLEDVPLDDSDLPVEAPLPATSARAAAQVTSAGFRDKISENWSRRRSRDKDKPGVSRRPSGGGGGGGSRRGVESESKASKSSTSSSNHRRRVTPVNNSSDEDDFGVLDATYLDNDWRSMGLTKPRDAPAYRARPVNVMGNGGRSAEDEPAAAAEGRGRRSRGSKETPSEGTERARVAKKAARDREDAERLRANKARARKQEEEEKEERAREERAREEARKRKQEEEEEEEEKEERRRRKQRQLLEQQEEEKKKAEADQQQEERRQRSRERAGAERPSARAPRRRQHQPEDADEGEVLEQPRGLGRGSGGGGGGGGSNNQQRTRRNRDGGDGGDERRTRSASRKSENRSRGGESQGQGQGQDQQRGGRQTGRDGVNNGNGRGGDDRRASSKGSRSAERESVAERRRRLAREEQQQRASQGQSHQNQEVPQSSRSKEKQRRDQNQEDQRRSRSGSRRQQGPGSAERPSRISEQQKRSRSRGRQRQDRTQEEQQQSSRSSGSGSGSGERRQQGRGAEGGETEAERRRRRRAREGQQHPASEEGENHERSGSRERQPQVHAGGKPTRSKPSSSRSPERSHGAREEGRGARNGGPTTTTAVVPAVPARDIPAAVKATAAKKSSATIFTSDPRAKKERAARMKARRMKA